MSASCALLCAVRVQQAPAHATVRFAEALAQAEAMEQAVRLVDDVMGVVNLLSVGTAREAVRYRVAPPQGR